MRKQLLQYESNPTLWPQAKHAASLSPSQDSEPAAGRWTVEPINPIEPNRSACDPDGSPTSLNPLAPAWKPYARKPADSSTRTPPKLDPATPVFTPPDRQFKVLVHKDYPAAATVLETSTSLTP